MIKTIIKKVMDFVLAHDRLRHIVFGVVMGLLLGVRAGLASAIAMECKDVQWNKMDWSAFDKIDMLMTMLGGIAGGLIRNLICYTCWGTYYPIGI